MLPNATRILGMPEMAGALSVAVGIYLQIGALPLIGLWRESSKKRYSSGRPAFMPMRTPTGITACCC